MKIAYEPLCFPPFGRFERFPQLTTIHGIAYKTLCFLTLRGPSGGAENAKSRPDASKTCCFFNILDFLGVTEMGPAAGPWGRPEQPEEALHRNSQQNGHRAKFLILFESLV